MSGKSTRTLKTVLAKIGLSVLLGLIAIILLAWAAMFAVAHGPSVTMRDKLIGMCLQSSAMKFLPYTVLDAELIDELQIAAAEGVTEVYSPSELENRYVTKMITDENGQRIEVKVLIKDDGSQVIQGDETGGEQQEEFDEWKYAIDGIQFIQLNRPNFKAYMLIIKDPTRIYCATSSNYKTNVAGARFNEIAEREQCVALINGGEFDDTNGNGNGGKPRGLTYSKGVKMWEDAQYQWKTFIGFNKDNLMVVEDNLAPATAEKLGVRDGCCFRPGSISCKLIYTDAKGSVHVSSVANSSPAQRSAIGQRADGAVIFLVTDGRSANSIGASYDDVTQLMYEFGAVYAGMLDGGSSSVLYYRDWFNLYETDVSKLDEYQKMGLVNKYVAATMPRRIPTFFCVGPSKTETN